MKIMILKKNTFYEYKYGIKIIDMNNIIYNIILRTHKKYLSNRSSIVFLYKNIYILTNYPSTIKLFKNIKSYGNLIKAFKSLY